MGSVIELKQAAHEKLRRDLKASVELTKREERLFLICDQVGFGFAGLMRGQLLRYPCTEPKVAEARDVAMTLAHELLGLQFEDLESYFNCTARDCAKAIGTVWRKQDHDYEFRIATRFHKSACAAILGLNIGTGDSRRPCDTSEPSGDAA